MNVLVCPILFMVIKIGRLRYIKKPFPLLSGSKIIFITSNMAVVLDLFFPNPSCALVKRLNVPLSCLFC